MFALPPLTITITLPLLCCAAWMRTLHPFIPKQGNTCPLVLPPVAAITCLQNVSVFLLSNFNPSSDHWTCIDNAREYLKNKPKHYNYPDSFAIFKSAAMN